MSYMSPEQALGHAVDPRSDIFSFGAVLYEMVTGRRAFSGRDAAATLSAMLNEEPKPPSQIVRGLPEELDRVLQRCLRKDASERFAHMAEVKIELEKLLADSTSTAEPAPTTAPLLKVGKASWRRIGIALIVAAIVAAAWYLRPKPDAAGALVPVPLTTDPGLEINPSLSPDGSRVAYTWTVGEKGSFNIYVKPAGGDEKPVALTTGDGVNDCAAWAPDGRTIAFLRFGGDKATLYQIAPLGGVERKIAEGVFRWSYSRDISFGRLSWTPDSKFIAAAAHDTNDSTFSIYLYSIASGERRRLTAPPNGATDQWPAISPDGRSLLFVRCAKTNYCDLLLTSLSADFVPRGEPIRLLPEQGEFGGASWTSDGKAIVYGYTKSGYSNSALFRLALDAPAKPVRLTFAGEGVTNPTISRRGNRLAYVVAVSDSDIWQLGPGGKTQPVAASTRSERSPQYSPDGTRIAFTSDRTGVPGVWTCGRDGSNPVHLTRNIKRYCGSPQWSPDGKQIAFATQGPEAWEIGVMDAEGGQQRQLALVAGNKNNPSWSNDGKWIYFSLTEGNSSRSEVWKAPADGGKPMQVTKEGGFMAVESPDSKWLYYTKSEYDSPLFRIPLAGGEETKVLEGVAQRAFQVFDDGIYYLSRGGGIQEAEISLRFHRLATGKSELIALLGGPLHAGLSVSPDRKRFLYSPFVRTGSDLMLVENFR